MNNNIKKIVSNMDYNTYIGLRNKMLFSECGLFAFNCMSNNLLVTSISDGLLLSMAALTTIMITNKCENYTKDVNYVNSLYKEFLNNYSKLNNTFNLNNPIEIYTMFNELLRNRYLSKDKEFKFNFVDNELNLLYGPYIFTGNGVCKHISTMLTDIYKNLNLESGVLVVDLLDNDIHSRVFGNHAITYVTKDNKDYFLDPTNSLIYKSINSNTLINNDGIEIPIINRSLRMFNDKETVKLIRNNLSKNNINYDMEELKYIKSILLLIQNNLDILEKFYKENLSIYEECSNKILNMKKNLI